MANLADTTKFKKLNSETEMYNADNVDSLIDGLSTNVYTKTEVDSKIADAASKVYRFKGSVATYQDLPTTGLTVGDVYNVEESGKNYAWTGSGGDKVGDGWDDIGGVIDLSGYYTKQEADDLLDDKVDKEAGKGLSTNDYTTAEKEKLANISNGAEVNQNAFSGITVGATTVSAASKTDTVELKGGDNVTLSVSGKIITINAAATDISGKANKTAFASLANLDSWPTSNYDIDTLVTKYNALVAVLKAIAAAV